MCWSDPSSRCPFIIRHACLLQRQANLGHHVFIGYRQKQICILPEKQTKSRTAHCDLIITNVSHRTIFAPKFKVHIF